MKFLIAGLLLAGAFLLWQRWRRSAGDRHGSDRLGCNSDSDVCSGDTGDGGGDGGGD